MRYTARLHSVLTPDVSSRLPYRWLAPNACRMPRFASLPAAHCFPAPCSLTYSCRFGFSSGWTRRFCSTTVYGSRYSQFALLGSLQFCTAITTTCGGFLLSYRAKPYVLGSWMDLPVFFAHTHAHVATCCGCLRHDAGLLHRDVSLPTSRQRTPTFTTTGLCVCGPTCQLVLRSSAPHLYRVAPTHFIPPLSVATPQQHLTTPAHARRHVPVRCSWFGLNVRLC